MNKYISRYFYVLLMVIAATIPSPLLAAPNYDSANLLNSNDELKILRITPHGNDVPAGQQIVIQFDRPVVAIGRMERDASEIPIEVQPALKCEWRWLNTSALACQLRAEDKMKLATRYDIKVRPGIKSDSGATLNEVKSHSFTTTRPKITYARFVNWLSPGTPLIQLTFNQPITKASLENVVTMIARNANNISTAVIAYADNLPRTTPYWMHVANKDNQLKTDDRLSELDGEEARRVWIVEPVEELPLNNTIWFDVSPGLESSEGRELGVENRTIVSFETYPEFSLIGIRCTLSKSSNWAELNISELTSIGKTVKQQEIEIDATTLHELAKAIKRCSPLNHVALVFSSPVKNSMVRDHVAFTPRLDGGRKDYNPWENVHDWTHLNSAHRTGQRYYVWLPEFLQAYQSYNVTVDINNFQDEFGRKLTAVAHRHKSCKIENCMGFNFFTAHREPKLRLVHHMAVLEKNVQTDIPLYVTNLDSIEVNYQKMTSNAVLSNQKDEIDVPFVEDVAFAIPMGVRDLVGENSGVIAGSLAYNPSPSEYWRTAEFFIQVTPFQVHAKIGHFNSLIWVTEFENGQAVSDAKVTIYKGTYENLVEIKEQNYNAITNDLGLANLPGISEIDPELEIISRYYRQELPRYFIKVERDDDIALLPLDRSFIIRSRDAYSRIRKNGAHSHSWGTTAQGVYKLGDKIEYKIYVREQSNKHWVSPRKESYSLKVYDPQSKVVHERNTVLLSEFGSFAGSFKVSEQGAVGWYRFELKPNFAQFTWQPMSVLVSDFTPAPFKVSTDINGTLFHSGDNVEVNSFAALHSGGPFTDAEVRLTARLKAKPFIVHNPKLKNFSFGSTFLNNSDSRYQRNQRNLLDVRGNLNELGQYQDVFQLPDSNIYYGEVFVEAAVKDVRGKFVASNARADFAGRDRFVGLKNTKWLYKKGETASVESVVVDDQGQIISGPKINIEIKHKEYKAARVKGPGNAYLTRNIAEWVDYASCQLKSDITPVVCKFTPEKPGYYRFVATIEDSKNRKHTTTIHGWVTGRGYVVWDQSNDATLQIIAEQTEYKIGDTARYLIKNPFPGSKALVSIERYGIIDSWVEELDTSTPVIEFPVKPDYLPGFYFSVVVVSPRVEKPLGPAKVDLGKPSYRMGYVTTKVKDPYKEIAVDIIPDKELYKPREKVKAKIHVQAKHGDNQEPFEIAVAVVDEAVLALNKSGTQYYNPYLGFNKIDALDVNNYSLISRLVGRQKFEKKGANPGGDGGESSYSALRNLFKFVSYWNPSITPDEQGNATVEFETPDNLTGWRILALAVTPSDRMGLGHTNIKVNRATEIRPVMPNQIIEGDDFKAGFNVMNRTSKPRRLDISIRVDGPLYKPSQIMTEYSINIPPYKRKNIWMPIQTKGYGELKFVVQAGDEIDIDALQHAVPVNKRRSLETAANYGTTVSSEVREKVKIPQGIFTDVGSVSVVLSPSVIGNIDGAYKYIKEYPYLCWEQRLTKAVMGSSYLELKEYISNDFNWPVAGSLVKTTLDSAANFQAPNGGMAYWISLNRYVSPYLSAYTALAFNWLRRDGYTIPSVVEARLHKYLLQLLRNSKFPTFYTKGMSSSVRAVALAALADHGLVTTVDIERYENHVPEMDLFGKAHFLQAAVKVNVSKKIVEETLNTILGHSSQSGGKFQFNEAWDDSYKYILATPLRSNCSILSSLLSTQEKSSLASSIGDIPFKLVRSITQSRGNRDHWENTQENVFCLNSLVDYSNLYEADDPSMSVNVSFNSEKIGFVQFTKKSNPPTTVARKLNDDDPGQSAYVKISKQGDGRLYYSTRVMYDLKEDNASRINSGIEVRREYSVEREGQWQLLSSPMHIQRGELVRIDLYVSTPTARHFVVVNDPVPGGLEPVNSNLATNSVVDAGKGQFIASVDSWWYKFSDWTYYGRYFWSFYHKELRHDSARFYADYLPAGNYHLSYTAQAIAEGDFSVMPVHVDEMYDPDVYGKGLPTHLKVAPVE